MLSFWCFLVLKRSDFDKVLTVKCQGVSFSLHDPSFPFPFPFSFLDGKLPLIYPTLNLLAKNLSSQRFGINLGALLRRDSKVDRPKTLTVSGTRMPVCYSVCPVLCLNSISASSTMALPFVVQNTKATSRKTHKSLIPLLISSYSPTYCHCMPIAHFLNSLIIIKHFYYINSPPHPFPGKAYRVLGSVIQNSKVFLIHWRLFPAEVLWIFLTSCPKWLPFAAF